MKYLTFVIIALTARVYIVASECWIPMVCNGIPQWAKMETTCHQNSSDAEMKKLMKNAGLTDQATDISNQLKYSEKKLEELKSRQAINNLLKTTIEEVQATTDSDGTTEIRTETTFAGTKLDAATQTTIVKTTGGSLCTYTYNLTLCYYVEMRGYNSTNYANAVTICENQGSEISQIYNKEIYEKVLKILRKVLLVGWHYTGAWIGLKIDTKTGEPTYPSTNAFTKWNPGFPSNEDVKKYVVLMANSVENDLYQGMWNLSPGARSFGVVCQVRTG